MKDAKYAKLVVEIRAEAVNADERIFVSLMEASKSQAFQDFIIEKLIQKQEALKVALQNLHVIEWGNMMEITECIAPTQELVEQAEASYAPILESLERQIEAL